MINNLVNVKIMMNRFIEKFPKMRIDLIGNIEDWEETSSRSFNFINKITDSYIYLTETILHIMNRRDSSRSFDDRHNQIVVLYSFPYDASSYKLDVCSTKKHGLKTHGDNLFYYWMNMELI